MLNSLKHTKNIDLSSLITNFTAENVQTMERSL